MLKNNIREKIFTNNIDKVEKWNIPFSHLNEARQEDLFYFNELFLISAHATAVLSKGTRLCSLLNLSSDMGSSEQKGMILLNSMRNHK